MGQGNNKTKGENELMCWGQGYLRIFLVVF